MTFEVFTRKGMKPRTLMRLRGLSAAKGRSCEACGAALPPPKRRAGRQRRYCSRSCRLAGWRAARAATETEAIET